MRLLKSIIVVLFVFHWQQSQAQDLEPYQHLGEIGVGVGGNLYFGDLNPTPVITHPKIALGGFYLHHFNNYIGVKLMANYVHTAFADNMNNRSSLKRRNLSASSNNLEITANAQFNFFSFIPGIEGHNFTPYLSVGAGILNYNPYTYINVDGDQQKVFLRPLGTEGQNSTTAHDGKKYGSIAGVFPVAMGLKYALSDKLNIFGEVGYRFTTTDYLDDVSTTYAGSNAFEAPNYTGNAQQQWYAQKLQDRSSSGVGQEGSQRGTSTAKDTYLVGMIGISFNINAYLCPKAK